MSTSDNSNASNNNAPLFQGLDEKERIYAPEQVPNAVHAPNELDSDPTAGTSSAVGAAGSGDNNNGPATIAGAEGSASTVPIVAVRPDVSANAPIIGLPATTDDTTD